MVFDGYKSENSTKVQVQLCRGSATATAVYILITEDKTVTLSGEHFRPNSHNKDLFIKLLVRYLETEGHEAIQRDGDADVLVVKQALEHAERYSVMVAADDRAGFVVLPLEKKSSQVFFSTEFSEKKKAAGMNFWSIRSIAESLPLVSSILFANAWSGCDTTSALYMKGKYSVTY